jgi:pimeloyl-ACP methyl ester carboxylesterase
MNMTTFTKSLAIPGASSIALTVIDQGEGENYLLLHGGAGPQTVTAFAQLLAGNGHQRVLTPTHPGFGGTSRPDGLDSVANLATLYVALLEALELDEVTVVGNSLGGWIAAEIALQHSSRVRTLVLIDAVGLEVEGHRVADVSGLSVPEIQALSFHDPSPFRVDPAKLSDEQRAVAASNAASLATYAGSPAMADRTLRDRLGRVTTPTLVLWGDSDRIVDPAYGKAYAAAIPGARFELLKATGHMPQLESPDLVLRAISMWSEPEADN